MRFTLNIDSDNATFTDDGYQEAVADLLSHVAEQVREGNTSGYPRDLANGQHVGHWEFDPAENPAEAEARDLVARITDPDEPLSKGDVYGSERTMTKRFMLSGNGPTVWFYSVHDQSNEQLFGVVEYTAFGPSTYAVVPQADAKAVDRALRWMR